MVFKCVNEGYPVEASVVLKVPTGVIFCNCPDKIYYRVRTAASQVDNLGFIIIISIDFFCNQTIHPSSKKICDRALEEDVWECF